MKPQEVSVIASNNFDDHRQWYSMRIQTDPSFKSGPIDYKGTLKFLGTDGNEHTIPLGAMRTQITPSYVQEKRDAVKNETDIFFNELQRKKRWRKLAFWRKPSDEENRIAQNANIQSIKGAALQYPVRNISDDLVSQAFLKQKKVYVCLTAHPDRIQNLPDVLDTLDLSNVEQVVLSLPKYYGNDKTKPYNIPDSLRKYPKLFINEIEKDDGPGTKLFPCVDLINQRGHDALAITVDDDWAYSPGMINEMITHAARHKDSAVSIDGEPLEFWEKQIGTNKESFKINGPRFPGSDRKPKTYSKNGLEGKRSDVLQGYAGVGYPAKKVNTSLMRAFAHGSKDCFKSDDMVISFVLALTGVDRWQTSDPYYLSFEMKRQQPYPWERGVSALSSGADTAHVINARKYKACYEYMIKYSYDEENKKFKTAEETLLAIDQDRNIFMNTLDNSNCNFHRSVPTFEHLRDLDPIQSL